MIKCYILHIHGSYICHVVKIEYDEVLAAVSYFPSCKLLFLEKNYIENFAISIYGT
jgi:hypothetical protein